MTEAKGYTDAELEAEMAKTKATANETKTGKYADVVPPSTGASAKSDKQLEQHMSALSLTDTGSDMGSTTGAAADPPKEHENHTPVSTGLGAMTAASFKKMFGHHVMSGDPVAPKEAGAVAMAETGAPMSKDDANLSKFTEEQRNFLTVYHNVADRYMAGARKLPEEERAAASKVVLPMLQKLEELLLHTAEM